jgi:hypothetical protein
MYDTGIDAATNHVLVMVHGKIMIDTHGSPSYRHFGHTWHWDLPHPYWKQGESADMKSLAYAVMRVHNILNKVSRVALFKQQTAYVHNWSCGERALHGSLSLHVPILYNLTYICCISPCLGSAVGPEEGYCKTGDGEVHLVVLILYITWAIHMMLINLGIIIS